MGREREIGREEEEKNRNRPEKKKEEINAMHAKRTKKRRGDGDQNEHLIFTLASADGMEGLE